MDIQRLAAFSLDGAGGNPAGVVLADVLPGAAEMQAMAADVGYSETVFAAPEGNGYRVRYFAPKAEVPFCGHATIALGAALGAKFGAGRFALHLNDAAISVEGYAEGDGWSARLTSPATRHRTPAPELRASALALFGWSDAELDPAFDVSLINAGARHLLIALGEARTLQSMDYDFDPGAALMQAHGLVTINLIWRESAAVIHSRNPFAGHGVHEDPATGAAAAALAGYLRDSGRGGAPFTVFQGADMGAASRLNVVPLPGAGQPVRIAGQTRRMYG